MKRFGLILACSAIAVLVIAPQAEAHKLTAQKARAALKPVATEITPTVAPAIAAKLPGATISKSSAGPCDIVKKGHRAECVIRFTIAGASTGETECAIDARVQFRSKTSRDLKISLGPVVVCLFPVPLG